MKRGRPRHDDVLTPREWEVLALLRDGLSNEAIASRLGVSLDTAKYHVSEILGKLGVSSREEAAAWQGQPRRGLAWFPAILKKWPFVAATVAGVGVLTILLTGGRDGTNSGSDDILSLPGDALADFVATPGMTVTPRSASSQPAEIELTVCIDDFEWTRPSREEQTDYINADMRYAPFGENAQSQFEASFYIGAGPGTGRGSLMGKMVLFSGLWTRGDGRQLQAELGGSCSDTPNMFADSGLIDLFLFGYGAAAARWDGERTVVTVGPRPAGFQAIQLRFPGPASDYVGPFVFVNTSGRVIGILGEEGFWSTPP